MLIKVGCFKRPLSCDLFPQILRTRRQISLEASQVLYGFNCFVAMNELGYLSCPLARQPVENDPRPHEPIFSQTWWPGKHGGHEVKRWNVMVCLYRDRNRMWCPVEVLAKFCRSIVNHFLVSLTLSTRPVAEIFKPEPVEPHHYISIAEALQPFMMLRRVGTLGFVDPDFEWDLRACQLSRESSERHADITASTRPVLLYQPLCFLVSCCGSHSQFFSHLHADRLFSNAENEQIAKLHVPISLQKRCRKLD